MGSFSFIQVIIKKTVLFVPVPSKVQVFSRMSVVKKHSILIKTKLHRDEVNNFKTKVKQLVGEKPKGKSFLIKIPAKIIFVLQRTRNELLKAEIEVSESMFRHYYISLENLHFVLKKIKDIKGKNNVVWNYQLDLNEFLVLYPIEKILEEEPEPVIESRFQCRWCKKAQAIKKGMTIKQHPLADTHCEEHLQRFVVEKGVAIPLIYLENVTKLYREARKIAKIYGVRKRDRAKMDWNMHRGKWLYWFGWKYNSRWGEYDNNNGIMIRVRAQRGENEMMATIMHEIAHQFINGNDGQYVSTWRGSYVKYHSNKWRGFFGELIRAMGYKSIGNMEIHAGHRIEKV